MNNNDLQIELSRNKSDKQLAKAELEASKKKWVDYILKNQEDICSNQHPIVVRKKVNARWGDFIDKIKMIFGLKKGKEDIYGIEAYLPYSINDE